MLNILCIVPDLAGPVWLSPCNGGNRVAVASFADAVRYLEGGSKFDGVITYLLIPYNFGDDSPGAYGIDIAKLAQKRGIPCTIVSQPGETIRHWNEELAIGGWPPVVPDVPWDIEAYNRVDASWEKLLARFGR